MRHWLKKKDEEEGSNPKIRYISWDDESHDTYRYNKDLILINRIRGWKSPEAFNGWKDLYSNIWDDCDDQLCPDYLKVDDDL